jgi:hypothetical protein
MLVRTLLPEHHVSQKDIGDNAVNLAALAWIIDPQNGIASVKIDLFSSTFSLMPWVRKVEEITAGHCRLLVVYREFNRYALRQL